MFDAQGNYSPPDQEVRLVLAVTEGFRGQLSSGFPVSVAKGTVLAVETSLGHTNVAVGQGPSHPKAALIEHATAKVGDVLPDAEVSAGIATAKARQDAVAKFRAADAAKPQAPAVAALTAHEIAALRALIAKP
jgi:hypothetical protein